jgi:hypothetical protein
MMTIMWKELLPCVAIIYSLGLLVFKWSS